MSSRLEFAQKLKDAGANADQVKQAFDIYRQKNGAFDDEKPAEAPAEAGKGAMDYLFPSANHVEGDGLGASAKRVGLGVMDALNIPTRALATVSGPWPNGPTNLPTPPISTRPRSRPGPWGSATVGSSSSS